MACTLQSSSSSNLGSGGSAGGFDTTTTTALIPGGGEQLAQLAQLAKRSTTSTIFPSPPLTPTSSRSRSNSLCLSSDLDHAASSAAVVSEIVFYETGDLILEAYNRQHEKVHLRVASTTLCIASPVFRAMLCPNRFREGNALLSCNKDSSVFILPLPDDDAESLVTLCHILHLNNLKVPRKISTEDLARLCVLLDKYVCTLAAVSWLDFWFSHVQPNTAESVDRRLEDTMWLYIALITGEKQRFRSSSAKVIMDLPSIEYMSDSQLEWFKRLPDGVQDTLVNTSQDIIRDIGRLLEEFCLGKLSKCQAALFPKPDHHEGNRRIRGLVPTARDCEVHSVGALVQALQREQIQPGAESALCVLARPSWWGGSASYLLDRIETIADNLATFVPPHQQCGHGRTLYRGLRELRYTKNHQGLDLEDFRGYPSN